MATRKGASAATGSPTIPATAGLGFYLREAYRAFSRDFHARLARHGITHAQWVILWFLSQAGSLTPLELSRRAGIQKASATSVIDALKKRRLIRGDQDSVDRRKVNLHLTPAGLETDAGAAGLRGRSECRRARRLFRQGVGDAAAAVAWRNREPREQSAGRGLADLLHRCLRYAP